MKVTIEQFKELLATRKGSTIVSLVTKTAPKMRKKGNPFLDMSGEPRIRHISRRTALLGVSYENAVNNQRAREAEEGETVETFNAEALWSGKGERISPSLVRHRGTGREYIVCMPTAQKDGFPTLLEDQWVDENGKEIDKSAILPFLPTPSHSKTQETDKEIFWRTIALESLVEVRMGGEIYHLSEDL